MRIVFLAPVGTLGGAERCLLDAAASLRSAHADLELHLVLGGKGPLAEAAAAYGVQVHFAEFPARLARIGDSGASKPGAAIRRMRAIAQSSGDVLSYVLALRALLLRLRPDVVHSNGMKMHVLSALANPSDSRLVWQFHDYLSQRALMSRALRIVSSRASAILAVSRSVADDALRLLPRQNVSVVYNAIDTDTFTPIGRRTSLDESSGTPPHHDVLRVGLIATYARWKGHFIFLEAARRVHRRMPNLKFYIVGGPQYTTENSQLTYEEVRSAITANGLDGAVGLVPFQTHPEEVYRSLDIVVHASTEPEPFGRTIVEAMACGCSVIAAREGGAAELVEHGVNALAIEPRDPTILADAIVQLASDASLRRRLGKCAREAAVTRFDRARLGAELLRVYEG